MERSADETLLGRLVAGKYEIQAYIGGGGMGAVYRARQVSLEKTIAVKVLHREIAIHPTFAQRFQREAKAASRLDHPNSVRIIDSGQDADGLLYIAMEYLDGRTLFRVLEDDGPMPDARIVDILSQTLAALSVAHGMGVVHRDLKPENIIIVDGASDDGERVDLVKVCDFGIAKIADPRADEAGRQGAPLTTDGGLIGTPEYMSPEQARGEALDPRSDLYSVGVILFQLLTGRLPFEAESAFGLAMRHVSDEPPLPHVLNSRVTLQLEAVCLKALKKNRDHRHQNAREMRTELRAALARASNRVAISTPNFSPTSETLPPPERALTPPTTLATPPASTPASSTPAIPASATPTPAPATPAPATPTTATASRRRAWPIVAAALVLAGPGYVIVRAVAGNRLVTPPQSGPSALVASGNGGAVGSVAADDAGSISATVQVPATIASGPAAGGSSMASTATSSESDASVASVGSVGAHPTGSTGSTGSIASNGVAAANGAALSAENAGKAGAIADVGGVTTTSGSTTATTGAATVATTGSSTTASTTTATTGTTGGSAVATSNSAAKIDPEQGRVVLGAVSTTNGLAGASVRKGLSHASFARCYRDALKVKSARAEGNASLSIAVDDTGHVTSATVKGADFLPGMRGCLESTARSTRIPDVDTGDATATVVLQFSLP